MSSGKITRRPCGGMFQCFWDSECKLSRECPLAKEAGEKRRKGKERRGGDGGVVSSGQCWGRRTRGEEQEGEREAGAVRGPVTALPLERPAALLPRHAHRFELSTDQVDSVKTFLATCLLNK